jgi:DNA-directed RNA polymerase subunit RPC12/RpoP
MERRSFGGPKNFGPREMTKVVCSECGNECEVPSSQLKEDQSIAGIACPSTGNPGSDSII